MKITREDKKRFPRFFNHDSARKWLRERYGSFFCLAGYGQTIKGERIYYYSLVQDRDKYLEWREGIAEGKNIDPTLYQGTYQACDITEGGKLTVYYNIPKEVMQEYVR